MSTETRTTDESPRATKAEGRVDVTRDEPTLMWKTGVPDPLTVPASSIPEMLRQGWTTRSIADIPDRLKGIELYIGQVLQNIHEFVTGVQENNSIDTQDSSAYTAALTARRLMDQEIDDLLSIIHGAYPTSRGDVPTEQITVIAQDVVDAGFKGSNVLNGEDQQTFEHDPSQFPMIDVEGNPRVVDPQQAKYLTTVGWHALGDINSIPDPEPATAESES